MFFWGLSKSSAKSSKRSSPESSKKSLKLLRKGRIRPRFKRENNSYKDTLYEGEESDDDLWGDEPSEAEVVIQETEAWKAKFWDHETDLTNPLELMNVMDDALKFINDPYIYSRNMSKNTSYSPDSGFVYH